ncbi:MAG TPA: hypothetical protein VIL36_01925 [Acidimicrobiales bacterium]
MFAWRCWLLAGVVVVVFLGVVLHGAEFLAADAGLAAVSAEVSASAVRAEPVGVVPAAMVTTVLGSDQRSDGPVAKSGAKSIATVVTAVAAPGVGAGAAVWWCLALPDRRRVSSGGRPAVGAGRAPPRLRVT